MSTQQTRQAMSRQRTRYAQAIMPVDFSARGWQPLPLAETLAQAVAASPLRLVHIDTSSPWNDALSSDLMLRARPFDQPVQVQVRPDLDAAHGIVGALREETPSLLVMSTHGRTGAAELVLGSVAETVLRKWDGPMVAAGPHYRTHAGINRIVVCVDVGTRSRALLRDVQSWAQALDVPIQVLFVERREPIPDLQDVHWQHRWLQKFTDRLVVAGERPAAVILRGSWIARDIVSYADAVPGTLLALSSHARPAVSRSLLGSVSMAVLRHTQNAVLLRRSDR